MKTIIKIFMLLVVFNVGTVIVPQKVSAQVSVSFQVFYDDLSPYGYWVDNSDYGYVWVPNVAPGFTPYGTNGYWVFTDAGWTWVSNYSWGWAPFHYGRWYSDPYYGYMWVPDNEWGPGWVTWRRSEGYYGWAPIGPGISIEFAYSSGYNLPYNQWVFVNDRDFGSTTINNYYINSSNNVTIINNSTVINNHRVDNSSKVKYNAGPDRIEVEKQIGKSITPIAIKESNKPGQSIGNGELQIYRPQVEKNKGNGQKPVPSKVTNMKDVKPEAERNKENQTNKQQFNKEPNKQQPNKQQQLNNQPNKQQPNKQQLNKEPNKQQPNKQQQLNKEPSKQQPNKQQQLNKEPSKQQPNKQQPNKQQQFNKEPNKQQPNKQQQLNKEPNKQQQANPHQNVKEEKPTH